jgi:hypothetical protein
MGSSTREDIDEVFVALDAAMDRRARALILVVGASFAPLYCQLRLVHARAGVVVGLAERGATSYLPPNTLHPRTLGTGT